MTDNSAAALLRQLVGAVEHLSLDARAQRTYLTSLGVSDADELGLEFDDVAAACLVRLAGEHPALARDLKELDDLLSSISGAEHSDLWTLDALDARDEWQRIREQSKEVLQELRKVVDGGAA